MKTIEERVNELTRAMRRQNIGTTLGASMIPQAVPPRPGARQLSGGGYTPLQPIGDVTSLFDWWGDMRERAIVNNGAALGIDINTDGYGYVELDFFPDITDLSNYIQIFASASGAQQSMTGADGYLSFGTTGIFHVLNQGATRTAGLNDNGGDFWLFTQDTAIVHPSAFIRLIATIDGSSNFLSYLELNDSDATPTPSSAQRSVFFTRVNGSGKQEACIKFSGAGAVQVVATEP